MILRRSNLNQLKRTPADATYQFPLSRTSTDDINPPHNFENEPLPSELSFPPPTLKRRSSSRERPSWLK